MPHIPETHDTHQFSSTSLCPILLKHMTHISSQAQAHTPETLHIHQFSSTSLCPILLKHFTHISSRHKPLLHIPETNNTHQFEHSKIYLPVKHYLISTLLRESRDGLTISTSQKFVACKEETCSSYCHKEKSSLR